MVFKAFVVKREPSRGGGNEGKKETGSIMHPGDSLEGRQSKDDDRRV